MEFTRLGAWLALGAMPLAAGKFAEVAQSQIALIGPAWRIDEAVTLVAAGAGAALAGHLTLYSVIALTMAWVRPGLREPRLAAFAPRLWRQVTATALGVGLSTGLAGPGWSTTEDDGGWRADAPVSIAWTAPEAQTGPEHTAADAPQAASTSQQPVGFEDLSLTLMPPASAVPAAPRGTYTVRKGDNLWDITRTLLGADASNAAVATAWPALYEANRDLVGADPGLIHTGHVLTIPESLA